MIDQREDDGRAFKCTLCYDRLGGGLEPACAKACPTESIQFGAARRAARAGRRGGWRELHEPGVDEARLYGRDPDDGVGGDGAFFLLLDEPEVYGLPPDPVVTTRDLPAMWRHVGAAAALAAGAGRLGWRRSWEASAVSPTASDATMVPEAEFALLLRPPILKPPVWKSPGRPAATCSSAGWPAPSAVLAAGGRR